MHGTVGSISPSLSKSLSVPPEPLRNQRHRSALDSILLAVDLRHLRPPPYSIPSFTPSLPLLYLASVATRPGLSGEVPASHKNEGSRRIVCPPSPCRSPAPLSPFVSPRWSLECEYICTFPTLSIAGPAETMCIPTLLLLFIKCIMDCRVIAPPSRTDGEPTSFVILHAKETFNVEVGRGTADWNSSVLVRAEEENKAGAWFVHCVWLMG